MVRRTTLLKQDGTTVPETGQEVVLDLGGPHWLRREPQTGEAEASEALRAWTALARYLVAPPDPGRVLTEQTDPCWWLVVRGHPVCPGGAAHGHHGRLLHEPVGASAPVRDVLEAVQRHLAEAWGVASVPNLPPVGEPVSWTLDTGQVLVLDGATGQVLDGPAALRGYVIPLGSWPFRAL